MLLGLGYAEMVLGLGRLLPDGSPQAWPWPGSSSRPAGGSRQPSTSGSIAGATTPPGSSSGSAATSRDQVELDTLTAEVLAVAEQTMQPTRASLWLRPPTGSGGA